jgi:hypothetical protein
METFNNKTYRFLAVQQCCWSGSCAIGIREKLFQISDPDPGSQTHISESLVNLWLQKRPNRKVVFPLLFFVVVGSGTKDPGWEKTGSGINIPDPQHCF